MRRWIVAGMVLAAVACIAAVFWAGDHLTRPARSATGAPPETLGAIALSFPSASGSTLSAWFVPGLSGHGAVLLLHPLRANKRAMLARARFLNRAGHALLLLDMQAHGESGGERIGFGHSEAADVEAATAQLRSLVPGEKLGVLGVSLGAAAFLYSPAQTAYAAAVLESVYPSMDDAVANRLRIHFGPAGHWLAPLLLLQLEPRLGVAARELSPRERLAQLRVPVLIVHGTEDRHTTVAAAERSYAAVPGEKAFYAVAGAAHVDLHAHAGAAYERRILAFFADRLRTEPTMERR